MNLVSHHFRSPLASIPKPQNAGFPAVRHCTLTPHTNNLQDSTPYPKQSPILTNVISLSLAITLNAAPFPATALPFSGLLQPPSGSATTPFSEANNLRVGLDNGKIMACPAINPGCISTNAKSSSFAFPWQIPPDSTDDAVQKLRDAILKTQKNVTIQAVEDTPNGKYLQAEVDGGGFGRRDVLEFLVRGDVVTFRCMATKVTYVYPFTTAFGDSKGQEQRVKQIVDQLGWYAPSFDSMD